jgi:hypothetical protein
MDDIQAMQRECNGKHSEVNRRLDTIEKDIHGNGRPGLSAQMAEVHVQLDNLNRTVQLLDPRIRQLERMGGIAVGALGALQLILKAI